MNLSRYGEDGIRVLFGNVIDLDVHEKVRHFFYFIKSLQRPDIIDIIPSFRSCLIHFDLGQTSYEQLSSLILEAQNQALSVHALPAPVTHEIPVHYGGEHGLDMASVRSHTGLTDEEIIDIHTGVEYTVYAVGFVPGFPYLGTLDPRLNVPRLETPRTRIPGGSVGIAQRQTGVYPFASPAGWRIIGRTDVTLFDPQKEPYGIMQIGDKVKFIRL
ncbi:MAG: allophanate hydrolase [Syntrophus sp. (in: bacteria)]|nr:allophanate hydrolase [Syntrophus sp. (in: bacteria)]